MLNQKDKLQRFVQVVEKNAADKCDEINSHVQSVLQSQLEDMQKQYSLELERRLEAESRKTHTEINRKITAIQTESRKIIAGHRRKISDRVFDEVRARLEQFCKGEEYPLYLEKCLKKITEAYSSDVEIFAKGQDIDTVNSLKKDFAQIVRVSADDSIRLGGIIAVSVEGSVRIDCTLGYELEQSREWFRANSFLNV